MTHAADLTREQMRQRLDYMLEVHPSEDLVECNLVEQYREHVTRQLLELFDKAPNYVRGLMFSQPFRIVVCDDLAYEGFEEIGEHKSHEDYDYQALFSPENKTLYLHAPCDIEAEGLSERLTFSDSAKRVLTSCLMHEAGHALDYVYDNCNEKEQGYRSNGIESPNGLFWNDLLCQLQHTPPAQMKRFNRSAVAKDISQKAMRGRSKSIPALLEHACEKLYEGQGEARDILLADGAALESPLAFAFGNTYLPSSATAASQEALITSVKAEVVAETLTHLWALKSYSDLSVHEIDKRFREFSPDAWKFVQTSLEPVFEDLRIAAPVSIETLNATQYAHATSSAFANDLPNNFLEMPPLARAKEISHSYYIHAIGVLDDSPSTTASARDARAMRLQSTMLNEPEVQSPEPSDRQR